RRPSPAGTGPAATPSPGAGEQWGQRLVRARRPLRGGGTVGGPRRGAALAPVPSPLHPPGRRELPPGRPAGGGPRPGSARGGRGGGAAGGADHRGSAVPGGRARCAQRGGGRGALRGQGPGGDRRVPRAEPRSSSGSPRGAGGPAPPLPGGRPVLAVVPPPPRP